jgi:uncharacterized protein (DUF433 family)
MKFSDTLFSLKNKFWEEYHENDGRLENISEPFKEMLIFFFIDKADAKIEEKVRAYNIKNWTNINPDELLEDLLVLRERLEQLPTDIIIECINYYRNNDEHSAGLLVIEYEKDNDLEEYNFTREILKIQEISEKYTDLPLELIGEFLDYLQE